jgi:hypothetical protein
MAMHCPLRAALEPSTRLDATFDQLMRRIEHATTLHERQTAIDTLFAHRRGTPPAAIPSTPRNRP